MLNISSQCVFAYVFWLGGGFLRTSATKLATVANSVDKRLEKLEQLGLLHSHTLPWYTGKKIHTQLLNILFTVLVIFVFVLFFVFSWAHLLTYNSQHSSKISWQRIWKTGLIWPILKPYIALEDSCILICHCLISSPNIVFSSTHLLALLTETRQK